MKSPNKASPTLSLRADTFPASFWDRYIDITTQSKQNASSRTMLQALILLSGWIALTLAQTPDDQCFWKNSGGTVAESTDGWHVCNNTKTTEKGASLCCLNGSQCGEDSICHFPGGSQGGTGWYLGGCTDGSYNDPVCPKACSELTSSKVWVLEQH